MKKTVIMSLDGGEKSLRLFGGIKLDGVKLKADRAFDTEKKGGKSAYVAFAIPSEYQGKTYSVDVDHIGKSTSAGILIGAASSRIKVDEPMYFLGYSCSLAEYGQSAQIGILDAYGWRSGMKEPIVDLGKEESLHYRVTVSGRVMTYSIYRYGEDKDPYAKPIIELRYEIGTDRNDVHDLFTHEVGVRQYYGDKGYFENFTVSVLEDDAIPALTESVTLCGKEFSSCGINVCDGVASGCGAMLSKEKLSGDYRISFSLCTKAVARLYFGMTDGENGYAFEINAYDNIAALYRIEDGKYKWLGDKRSKVRETPVTVTLDVHGGIASCFYDDLLEGGSEFAKVELYLDSTDGSYGLWLEDGSVSDLAVGESVITLPEETYINPINPGADPDMLFYEGTYYLYVYNTSHNGKEVFRVFTSKDLAHFEEGPVIFEWRDEYSVTALGGSSFSPNVSYNKHDGLFYLFFAAVRNDGSRCRSVFYATSKSPYGPFVHDGPLVPVNEPSRVRHEIDGHPFYDDDGRIYMSFSRSENQGSVWFEEVEMKNGVVTPKPETDTCIFLPDKSYECDGSWALCEGGYIKKHNGYYYAIYATACYARHYGEAYAVSKNPLGPYEKYEFNPILKYNSTLDGPGDALIVPSPDESELYMIYHRHLSLTRVDQRQTCVDLIKFVKDPDGGPDVLVVRGPSSTPQRLPSNKK